MPNERAQSLSRLIESSGFSWHHIANEVLKISDKYNQGKALTPWKTLDERIAYLAYFFPLNYLRLKAVFEEVMRLNLPLQGRWIDFGSGPGTSYFVVRELGLNVQHFSNVEIDAHAVELHKSLLGEIPKETTFEKTVPSARGYNVVASFALNEVNQWPQEILSAENLILIEPSLQATSRALQNFRKELIKSGFSIWAPCTHHENCPLLEKSKTDWCHNRVHVDLPDWFEELNPHLPMRNQSLTYSYLVASKTQRPERPVKGTLARVIGDTLFERGKVRQAICRGPNREFISWLTKSIDPQILPHGARVLLPDPIDLRGNEIRLNVSLRPLVGQDTFRSKDE